MYQKVKQIDITTDMDTTFNYMLLGRLISDCKYFLGNGNGYEKDLWAGSIEKQIAKMKELWHGFTEKPIWTSLEEIEEFERLMLETPCPKAE